jgi:hypothetical protein
MNSGVISLGVVADLGSDYTSVNFRMGSGFKF